MILVLYSIILKMTNPGVKRERERERERGGGGGGGREGTGQNRRDIYINYLRLFIYLLFFFNI